VATGGARGPRSPRHPHHPPLQLASTPGQQQALRSARGAHLPCIHRCQGKQQRCDTRCAGRRLRPSQPQQRQRQRRWPQCAEASPAVYEQGSGGGSDRAAADAAAAVHQPPAPGGMAPPAGRDAVREHRVPPGKAT
jgi:hypothetical protein